MNLFDAIASRYSYRGEFADSPLPRADLAKIAQAGIQAPSACNAQVVSFVIVDDAKLVRQIAEILGKPFCLTAKAMIVCLADPRPVYSNLSFAAEDCAAAVENMLLAITALGYASVWLDGVVRAEGRAVRIGRLLDVPPDRQVRIVLPIGVPVEPGAQRDRFPFTDRAWFNRYGGAD
ncbi:MAG: nitroreductase family protein [Thermoguttaceae bacterium]